MEKHNNNFRDPEKKVRLIDANKLEERVKISDKPAWMVVRDAPTVGAEPVVHGHWVKHNFLGHDQFACSECQTLGSPQWKRCPVCEAKMDGERKDNDL